MSHVPVEGRRFGRQVGVKSVSATSAGSSPSTASIGVVTPVQEATGVSDVIPRLVRFMPAPIAGDPLLSVYVADRFGLEVSGYGEVSESAV